MRITKVSTLVVLVGVMAAVGADAGDRGKRGTVVVANRASGDLSLIDVRTDRERRQALPRGENPAEPMYVVHHRGRYFVGDRGNDRVVVFDARSHEPVGRVPTGAGVFHMWAGRDQVWVVNDVDKTMTVFDPKSLRVLATVDLPADLAADGGKPHDTIVAPRREHRAYVTVVGLSGDHDAVIQFDTRSFRELARARVGKDPHLSLSRFGDDLYVPAQDADAVHVFRRRDLDPIATIDVPAAHGAGMRRDGRVFYTTNIAGGGPGGLVAIDTRDNTVLGATDTLIATPHNVALVGAGRKIYVTHSGATADQVSIYRATRRDPVARRIGQVTVGTNPFGLAWVPRGR